MQFYLECIDVILHGNVHEECFSAFKSTTAVTINYSLTVNSYCYSFSKSWHSGSEKISNLCLVKFSKHSPSNWVNKNLLIVHQDIFVQLQLHANFFMINNEDAILLKFLVQAQLWSDNHPERGFWWTQQRLNQVKILNVELVTVQLSDIDLTITSCLSMPTSSLKHKQTLLTSFNTSFIQVINLLK